MKKAQTYISQNTSGSWMKFNYSFQNGHTMADQSKPGEFSRCLGRRWSSSSANEHETVKEQRAINQFDETQHSPTIHTYQPLGFRLQTDWRPRKTSVLFKWRAMWSRTGNERRKKVWTAAPHITYLLITSSKYSAVVDEKLSCVSQHNIRHFKAIQSSKCIGTHKNCVPVEEIVENYRK